MSIADRIDSSIIPKRDSDANDTPLETRVVHYTDSSGVVSGKRRKEVKMYNGTGAPIVKGTVLLVHYTGLPATSPQVVVTATNTPTREVVVAVESVATAAWGWFCMGGWVDAYVNGTTDVAIGDLLKITQATSAIGFIKDSSTTYSTGTIAVAGAVSTLDSDNITLVEFLGGKSIIA